MPVNVEQALNQVSATATRASVQTATAPVQTGLMDVQPQQAVSFAPTAPLSMPAGVTITFDDGSTIGLGEPAPVLQQQPAARGRETVQIPIPAEFAELEPAPEPQLSKQFATLPAS